ncbi:hypothetical protein VTO73DRAFT_4184 [Trametes versicolor]
MGQATAGCVDIYTIAILGMSPRQVYSHNLSPFDPPMNRTAASCWNLISSDPETTYSTRHLYSTTMCLPQETDFVPRAGSPEHATSQDCGTMFGSATILYDAGESSMRIPHSQHDDEAPCLPPDFASRQAVYRPPQTALGNTVGSGSEAVPGSAPTIFSGTAGCAGGGALTYENHDPAYENLVVPSATGSRPQYADPFEWIIPQTVYARGFRRLERPVASAFLNILVRDIVQSGHLWQLRETADNYHAAFPDPEGRRKNQKFTVRFVFQGLPNPTWRPRQFNEYRRPEGSVAQAPLSRIDFAVIVVDQLCDFLRDQPLRVRGRPVDITHLLITELVRPSKASVQPVFMIHPDFWHLYG